MKTRPFDPACDTFDMLAQLSPFSTYVQEQFAAHYSLRTLIPENILLLEDAGNLIGVAHIFDGGLPWAIVDGIYIKPEHRGLDAALALMNGINDELAARGLSFYTFHADTQMAEIFTTRYGCKRAGDGHSMLVKTL